MDVNRFFQIVIRNVKTLKVFCSQVKPIKQGLVADILIKIKSTS